MLIDKKRWMHLPPGILKCGRVSHFIDEPPEGVDPDEYTKKINEIYEKYFIVFEKYIKFHKI